MACLIACLMACLPSALPWPLAAAAAATPAPTATPATAALKAGVFEPPRAAPEFQLRGADGGELRLSRFRGKVVVLSFGYTHCAEVCPVTLATLAQARRALGPDAGAVQVVFVTVDPERDDAARVKSYLVAFDPSFVGAIGDAAALAAVRRDYGVVARRQPQSGGYGFDHSSSAYLIDRDGRLRALMPFGHGAADYVHDLRVLLR